MTLHIDSKYVNLISHKVRNFKRKKDNLWNFSCPLCGDSQRNKTKARGYVFQKGNGLFYRCHNCSASTNLGNLLKNLDASLHKEYVLERYKSGESGFSNFKDPNFNIPTPKFGKVERQQFFQHGEYCDKLPSGHFCLDYLRKRGVPAKHYKSLIFTSKYRDFVSEILPGGDKNILNDARLVIPFYNEYNELIAVSGRALETNDKILRYITLRTTESDDKLIYGLDRIDFTKKIRIVEGPIDSLFIHNCLASGDANLDLVAKSVVGDSVLIFDNEPRNREIVNTMSEAINSGYNVVIWPNNVKGKDINEMIMNGLSSDEIEDIISSNTFKGLQAQTKFVFWKKV